MAGSWRLGSDWSPRQHSSGGKQVLVGISKRGDTYLRTLLIHGVRAVIRVAERKASNADSWPARLMGRRKKNARTVWALLMHGWDYEANYRIAA